VTLAEAIAWATTGLNEGAFIQDRAQAIANATKGLTKNWPASS
jgi:hypothetical protein